MPLTATVDAANARVELVVDFTDQTGTQTYATLYRRVGSATAPREYVRGLYGTGLLGEQKYVTDTEAPLDRAVYYEAVGGAVAAVMTAGPVTVPGSGYVWMKDPGRPWADLRLDLCLSPDDGRSECAAPADALAWVGFQNKVRAADAGLFDVLDREVPADVYARRKDVTSTWSFLSRTREVAALVYDLYTVGGPLFFQLPDVYNANYPGYRELDRYYQPGDLTEAYISSDQRRYARLWSAPVTSVAVPVGEPQGTDTANWCALDGSYAAYSDLTGAGYTWGQVAAGEASAAGTPGTYGFGPYGSGPYGSGG